jgi:hypothetical protein
MDLDQITLKGAAVDPASGARPLALAAGKELAARVVSVPPAGGRGLITLAGVVLEARLPAGLTAGQTLSLRVARADARELVVRIQPPEQGTPDGEGMARPAGQLALRGDGELLRAALGLAGGPLWLPGGAAATVTVEPDSGHDGGSEDGEGGEAVFTLHCPGLGAVEVRMRLDSGGIRAAVTTPPGAMTDRAAATLPDLVAGLERATGRPGIASVRARRGSEPRPAPPEGAYDGYA